MYCLVAVFKHETKKDQFTIYDEVQFTDIGIADDFLDGEYGEFVSNMATIDCKTAPELDGYWLDDVTVREVGYASLSEIGGNYVRKSREPR